MTKTGSPTRIASPKRQIFLFVLFGFSSGVPFLLTLSTLNAWLVETGATPGTIGLFVLVTLPYTLKFLMSPWVDRFYLPDLTKRLGQRRSCALFSQFFLLIFLVGLGQTNPQDNLSLTAFFAFCVCFSAALQDLVLEAYRVETTTSALRGASASAVCFGFRIGLMTSGAGALYVSSFCSWGQVYALMAGLIAIGMLGVLGSENPPPFQKKAPLTTPSFFLRTFWKQGVCPLFQHQNPWIILIFVFLYKMTDTILNTMSMPFLLSLGYSKIEIAEIAKLFGISTMIIGGFVAGGLLTLGGLWISLLISLFLQLTSCSLFILQAWIGYSPLFLIGIMGIENFTSGLTTTLFVAYISALCRPPYTATQYAFLASVGSLARILWSVSSGFLADHLSWHLFFGIVGLGCFPGFWILWHQAKSFRQVWQTPNTKTA